MKWLGKFVGATMRSGILRFRVLSKVFLSVFFFALSMESNAQLSKYMKNIAGEAGNTVLFIQFIAGCVGFICFVWAFFEYKKQKASSKDYGFAHVLLAVGVALGIATPLYLETTKSVTSEDATMKTDFDAF